MIHASREDWLKLRVGIEQENLNRTVSHSDNNTGAWFGPSGIICDTGDFKSASKPLCAYFLILFLLYESVRPQIMT